MQQVATGTMTGTAFIDPGDPTMVYVTQPELPVATQGRLAFYFLCV